MKIIEIKKLDNGAHRNQTGGLSSVPEGWAVVPDDLVTENFPFGEVTVEDIDGVPTVTKWVPLPRPEPETEPAPDPEPTTEQRVTDLEEAVELLLSGATEETEVPENEA